MATMQPTSTQPRDFSGTRKSVTFTADGDTFYGVPRVATVLLGDVVNRVNAASDDNLLEKITAVAEFFNVCLTDESAALMTKRLRDKNNPIDIPQAMDIIAYLIEEYGNRPTQPSPSSTDGSQTEETGTTSTAGVPSEVLIPLSSPLLAS